MAPEPPPMMSVQWQMHNSSSYTNNTDRGNNSPTKSTIDDNMDDQELHKLMALNGHTNTMNNNYDPRKSVTKKYQIPQAPLHATIAVINEERNHLEEIIKNNPYKSHKLIKKPIMPITRPSNHLNINKPRHSSQASYHQSPPKKTSYKHTITNMEHHQKESKTLDMFLQHRTPESVLKKKAILPSNNMQSNDDINKAFWNNQKQKKLQIQSTLSRKLSNKFRPQQNELYDRGIYVTDPKVVYHIYTQFRTKNVYNKKIG